LLERLVTLQLLTKYQADQITAGVGADLILGNYRVLDRLGAGGGGVVLKGQHLRFRRPVAIKVLTETPEQDPKALPRFFAEMEAIGRLRHPNIVYALDAGEIPGGDEHAATLHYLVMEYVSGQDLAETVKHQGPLASDRACDLISQVAGALAEAHRQQLVHRDVKPSNVLVTPAGEAKLVDFGLARHFGHRMTEPGIPMGTLDFMAPEQARDSSTVDARADIFGLGGTLFWCLTGQTPFSSQGAPYERLLRRLIQPAASVRSYRPDLPAALEAAVARMLATEPDDRYPSMEVVQQALLPFRSLEGKTGLLTTSPSRETTSATGAGLADAGSVPSRRVLIVDDDSFMSRCNQGLLEQTGIAADRVASGEQALEALRARPYSLVLLDIEMPGLSGLETLRQLRQQPPCAHLKVIMCSGTTGADEMAEMLLAGADDYLTKPFSHVQLQARVKAALLLKETQDRSDLLNRQLLDVNAELEKDLQSRESTLIHAHKALVLALARLTEQRSAEPRGRLQRLSRYCRCLAEAAARLPSFAGQIDPNYVQMLDSCVPLYDLGKVALPDHILLKPGKLDAEERTIMETHTTVGADILRDVADRYRLARPFLQMAIDVARHHHERYDGTGYPDRQAGDAIPLAARLVMIGDVYDALRCRRPHRPPLSHPVAMRMILEEAAGHFDPSLLEVFRGCSDTFDQIFREVEA
jgi:response regulator RpfG family c-di-GMP phosphodiesterase